jgi:hypothetical protein
LRRTRARAHHFNEFADKLKPEHIPISN